MEQEEQEYERILREAQEKLVSEHESAAVKLSAAPRVKRWQRSSGGIPYSGGSIGNVSDSGTH